MTPADKTLRLQETWAEQSENLRIVLRAAAELEANAQRLGAWSATPTDAERDVQDRFIFRHSGRYCRTNRQDSRFARLRRPKGEGHGCPECIQRPWMANFKLRQALSLV